MPWRPKGKLGAALALMGPVTVLVGLAPLGFPVCFWDLTVGGLLIGAGLAFGLSFASLREFARQGLTIAGITLVCLLAREGRRPHPLRPMGPAAPINPRPLASNTANRLDKIWHEAEAAPAIVAGVAGSAGGVNHPGKKDDALGSASGRPGRLWGVAHATSSSQWQTHAKSVIRGFYSVF